MLDICPLSAAFNVTHLWKSIYICEIEDQVFEILLIEYPFYNKKILKPFQWRLGLKGLIC